MDIKFCGANEEVTGSAHLITLDSGFKILLDCGLYQGHEEELEDFNEKWLFKPNEIDCVILSHAHIDHSGRLPKLVKDGFGGNIYCTHATRSLCNIMLLDSAMIQERGAEYKNRKRSKIAEGKKKPPLAIPLYKKEDVKATMARFAGFFYDKWFQINEQVSICFKDAGHILGSASVTLKITKKDGSEVLVGFTGDIGRPNRPILRDPQKMPTVDYLICESTYGGKTHLGKPKETTKFLDVIHNTCVEKGGKLIIPAFSIGRTQEIVYMLDQLETAGKLPKIKVYVDSPLAVNATMIFGLHPECYDNDLHEYMLTDPNPFGFNNLTYVRAVEASKAINSSDEPCIIISSSGMMNAGRVKHHLFNNIESPKNTLLIVGYCSPNTPGGKLRKGAEEIKLFRQMKQVNCEVVIMDSFSAHADQDEILDFIGHQKDNLKGMFLVHGNKDRAEALKKHLKFNGFENVEVPFLGHKVYIDK